MRGELCGTETYGTELEPQIFHYTVEAGGDSWLVYDVNEVTLSTLIKGQGHFVRVDNFNENGITPGQAIPVKEETL